MIIASYDCAKYPTNETKATPTMLIEFSKIIDPFLENIFEYNPRVKAPIKPPAKIADTINAITVDIVFSGIASLYLFC